MSTNDDKWQQRAYHTVIQYNRLLDLNEFFWLLHPGTYRLENEYEIKYGCNFRISNSACYVLTAFTLM